MDLRITDLPHILKDSTILLDTNFFLDSYVAQNRKVYGQFVDLLKENKAALTSPSFVKYEFVRSKTIDVVREKEKHFNRIVDYVLPFDINIDELMIATIEEYKDKMEGLPIVDLILATYLKRYKGLYLLTRDHTDFSTSVFTREHIFNLELFREKIYAIYSYKPKTKELEEEIPF